jgi:hypothetical protein
MKKIILFIIILQLSLFTWAQTLLRKDFSIPDIPGFFSLKADFHLHTIFSDGDVMPEVRVQETWVNGLDAIAITDHIEYHPHDQFIPVNLKVGFEMAKMEAEKFGMIIIKAAEITRNDPYGHLNCYFLKDIERLNNPDFYEAINEAVKQDAFIILNHPERKLKNPEAPVWYPIHDSLYDLGIIKGIEVVNENTYYPYVQSWANEKSLTLFGGSDLHRSVFLKYKYSSNEYRPFTLVFVNERTEEGIREAFVQKRTLVYYSNTLIGNENLLTKVFDSSIEMVNTTIPLATKEWKSSLIMINNKSSITYKLRQLEKSSDVYIEDDRMIIYPGLNTFSIWCTNKNLTGQKIDINIPFCVENLYFKYSKGISVNLEFKISFL